MVATNVPIPRADFPVVNKEGRLTGAWFRFFQLLRERTGGGTDAVAASSPVGSILDFAGDSAPNGWLLCDGSDVSRVTYVDLFNSIGTTYGSGDGSTTFGLPDCRGRMHLGSGTGAGLSARAVGDIGGDEDVALTAAQNGSHSHSVTDAGHVHAVTDAGHVHAVTDTGHIHAITDPGHDHSPAAGNFVLDNAGTEYDNTNGDKGTVDAPTATNTTGITVDNATTGLTVNNQATGLTVNNQATGISIGSQGSGDAHENMSPFIVFLKIIKT